MAWERLPPIKPKIHGCLHAPMQEELEMDEIIAVGFGDAHVEKDGEIVYREPTQAEIDEADEADYFEGNIDIHKKSLFWSVQDAENEAAKDPDHDWRIVLYAPLRGRTFQRHGKDKWVLIEENMGFA